MRIRRPVTVKLLITDQTKSQLLRQCEQSMRQLDLELEQLSFERRKLLHRAEKQGHEAVQQAEKRLQQEASERQSDRERLKLQYEQIEQLEEGSEIVQTELESEVTVQLGDNWEQLMKTAEIVLKDGIVYEIRGGEKK